MSKHHFKLQHSETIIVQSAARIYAAYIIAGRVEDGQESQWMKRAIKEALIIARTTDDAVISDDEILVDDGQNPGDTAVGRMPDFRSRHSTEE